MSKKQTKKETQKQSITLKTVTNCDKIELQSPPETQEMRRDRQNQILESLNRENIHRYLRNIEPHTSSDQLAQKVAQNTLSLVQKHLEKGILGMPNAPLQLPQQQKPVPKLSSEEMKELQIRAKRDQKQKKIDYLYEQIRGQNSKYKDTLTVQFKDVLSKEEHQQKVQHILAEKAQRRRRMQVLSQEQQRKKKEQEEREEELRALERQKRKEERRNTIQSSLKKRKEQHEKILLLDKQLQKEYQEARNRDRLYHKMEQRYQSEVLLPSLEEKKNKLRQLRQFHQRYDLQAIREHQKNYSLLHEASQEHSSKKELKKPQYRPPAHSARISRFLQEEALALKERLQLRKSKNQEKQRRIYSFQKEVKKKYQPKIDQAKKQQILQRYLQQARKQQKLNLDPRKLGEEYLEIAKRMRKSERYRKSVKTDQKTDEPSKITPTPQLSRAGHRSEQFYQRVRRKRMESILNSEEHSVMEKCQLLKLQGDKLQQKIRQKEELARMSGQGQAQQQAAQLLLSSIMAKMGLMEVLRHGKAGESADAQNDQ